MKQIHTLVIGDQPLVRDGLGALFARSDDVTTVGEVDTGDAALRALMSCTPEIVLLDLDLGGEDGLKVIARIGEVAPGAKVLAITAARDPERHRAALLAGARGVVTKDKPSDVILKAIRKVASDELWFERQLLERTVTRTVSRNGRTPPHDALTERETEIVSLVGEGLKNREIAGRLRIREKTVSNHLTSIFGKLGVSDRVGLLVRAYQLGMAAVPRSSASSSETPLVSRDTNPRGRR